MVTYKNIELYWNDEPDEPFVATVCVGAEWDEKEDDQHIFFYFPTQKDFDDAITCNGVGYEFTITAVHE